ncbi:MAG: XrtA system polysaccharide deacetylase [Gemmatimonadota bacterium]
MTPPIPNSTAHFFSVDVEDYFQVSAFDGVVSRDSWDSLPSRVERNTLALLDLLAERGAHGTFFTLGWVARKHPEVLKRIVAGGHEVASHGWWHRRVSRLAPEQFRQELRESKDDLEAASGQQVLGFRAPSFSIVPGLEWAFDVLLEEGYRYDSSLFPIRRPDYGYPSAPPIPHLIRRPSGTLLELPLATTRFAGIRIPAAGGGYLRQFPYGLIRRAFRESKAAGIPAMFYIHPWEIDVDQPRLPVGAITRFRHYNGLSRSMPRLRRLLDEFKFCSVRDRYGAALLNADPAYLVAAVKP